MHHYTRINWKSASLTKYSKFCLIAKAWDRNLGAVQLKGVQLGKVWNVNKKSNNHFFMKVTKNHCLN